MNLKHAHHLWFTYDLQYFVKNEEITRERINEDSTESLINNYHPIIHPSTYTIAKMDRGII